MSNRWALTIICDIVTDVSKGYEYPTSRRIICRSQWYLPCLGVRWWLSGLDRITQNLARLTNRITLDSATPQVTWKEARELGVNLSKWFYDTSTRAATGAARCGSFVGKAFSLLVVAHPKISISGCEPFSQKIFKISKWFHYFNLKRILFDFIFYLKLVPK
jgi:hypothetical protein